jgi:hypothetical protein
MDLVHVCGSYNPFDDAVKLVVLAVLSGGVPAGVLALALESWTLREGRTWSIAWSVPFQFALFFQLCSLALTISLLLGSVLAASWLGLASVPISASLLLSAVTSALATRSWRTLQTNVVATLATIA